MFDLIDNDQAVASQIQQVPFREGDSSQIVAVTTDFLPDGTAEITTVFNSPYQVSALPWIDQKNAPSRLVYYVDVSAPLGDSAVTQTRTHIAIDASAQFATVALFSNAQTQLSSHSVPPTYPVAFVAAYGWELPVPEQQGFQDLQLATVILRTTFSEVVPVPGDDNNVVIKTAGTEGFVRTHKIHFSAQDILKYDFAIIVDAAGGSRKRTKVIYSTGSAFDLNCLA